MSEPRLFIFDDRRARRWAPFTLTRPVGELLFGCLTLRERAEYVFGTRCEGHITRSALRDFDEPGGVPSVAFEEIGTEGIRIFLSSRCAPELRTLEIPGTPARLNVADQPAGWIIPDGEPLPSELWIRDPSAAAGEWDIVHLEGTVLGRPWDLVAETPEQITQDVPVLWPEKDDHLPGLLHTGDKQFSVGDNVQVEPGIYVDTRKGPVRLADGTRVEGPARLTGPLFVGASTHILGGHIGSSSIGPASVVRGEVSGSVFLSYANKAHDGYIGCSMLGRWVNLGAFTTNSDLKNNYRPVRVWTPEGDANTGMLKIGCFLGDHVKTGIGTILTTGTLVGAGSNLFGGVMPPSVVPPFSWGSGPDLHDYRWPEFLNTAEQVVARRQQKLTPGMHRILLEAWQKATTGRPAE